MDLSTDIWGHSHAVSFVSARLEKSTSAAGSEAGCADPAARTAKQCCFPSRGPVCFHLAERDNLMKRPRILLADDHRLMLEGLQRLLHDHYEVVGAVEDGRAAVEAAQQLKPDLILLDISMPVMNGFEAARQLKSRVPECKIIFLTMHADPMYASEAFRAGGAGYILKRSAATELVQAVQVVLEGRPYATPAVVKDLLRPLVDGAVKLGDADGLSPEEQKVLRLMAEGRSATEIAGTLNIPVGVAAGDISKIIELLNLQRCSS